MSTRSELLLGEAKDAPDRTLGKVDTRSAGSGVILSATLAALAGLGFTVALLPQSLPPTPVALFVAAALAFSMSTGLSSWGLLEEGTTSGPELASLRRATDGLTDAETEAALADFYELIEAENVQVLRRKGAVALIALAGLLAGVALLVGGAFTVFGA